MLQRNVWMLNGMMCAVGRPIKKPQQTVELVLVHPSLRMCAPREDFSPIHIRTREELNAAGRGFRLHLFSAGLVSNSAGE